MAVPKTLVLVAAVAALRAPPRQLQGARRTASLTAGSFAELGVDAAVVDSLRSQGIDGGPTPIQAAAFAQLRRGDDAVLHAETGSGKTLAYALPLYGRDTLILAPGRALAAQITEVLDATFEGHLFRVSTPKDALADPPKTPPAAVVLDECDALLRPPGKYASAAISSKKRERPAAKVLRRLLQKDSDIQVVAASATVGRPLKRAIDALVREAVPAKPREAMTVVRAAAPSAKRAVSAPSRLRHVVARFWDRGAGAGDVSDEALEALSDCLACFDATRCLVVVAGEGAGRVRSVVGDDVLVLASNDVRGLDPDVDVVVSLGRPRSCDEYLHVAGRTARNGAGGVCVTLCDFKDAKAVESWSEMLEVRFESVDVEELGGVL